MSKVMYVADYSYSEVSIAKIVIEKETEKTIVLSDYEFIIEGYLFFRIGKRVHKDSLALFDTLQEAIEFLIKQVRSRSEYLQQEIQNNKVVINDLRRIKE